MNPATRMMATKLSSLAGEGMTYADAAKEIDGTYHYVASFAKRYGIVFRRGQRGRPAGFGQNDPNARSDDMCALYKDGQTLIQIGAKYEVTRERVRQIIHKYYGVRGQDGGKAEAGRKKRKIFLKKRDARMMKHWGCSYKDYQRVLKHPDKPTYSFSQQRKNAQQRDIGWELSLWQWWKIWEHSGHWNDRGRGSGYGMCRLNDTGPYSIDNVYIATGIENIQDYWVNKRASNLAEAAA